MKKEVKIIASVKNIYVGKLDNDSNKFTLKPKQWTPNNGIYLECHSKYAL